MRGLIFSLLTIASLGLFSQMTATDALVSTRGTATVYVLPDEALLNFTILTEGEDLSVARDHNYDISSQTITYLKSVGIESKHIQTKRLSIGVRYRDRHRTGENRYYEARQYFTICVKDLERYEETIIGLLEHGIYDLSAPTFRTTNLREAKDEARRKAIVAAKEKAAMLAKELGQGIGNAHTIQEVVMENHWIGQQNAYANTSIPSESQSDISEAGFAPGQLEVKASIDVSFHLLND